MSDPDLYGRHGSARTSPPSCILDVRDLSVEYVSGGLRRSRFTALHDVSIDVRPGETVGLVGESGSGKSTLGRAVLGLAPVRSGTIAFDGVDITRASRRERRTLASSLQVVFQDPYNSLNPAMAVGQILAEPLTVSEVSSTRAREVVREALDLVHLPADAAERRPHEFSGGQRQRIAIARALVMQPRLIVCDEPLSALDLATQAHIIDLFVELQERLGTAYLFISHDLHVVRHLCHRVSVMRRGRIVEAGPAEKLTSEPSEDYTRELLEASPVPDPRVQKARAAARSRGSIRVGSMPVSGMQAVQHVPCSGLSPAIAECPDAVTAHTAQKGSRTGAPLDEQNCAR